MTLIAESLLFTFVEHAVTINVSNRVRQYYLAGCILFITIIALAWEYTFSCLRQTLYPITWSESATRHCQLGTGNQWFDHENCAGRSGSGLSCSNTVNMLVAGLIRTWSFVYSSDKIGILHNKLHFTFYSHLTMHTCDPWKYFVISMTVWKKMSERLEKSEKWIASAHCALGTGTIHCH